MAGRADVLMAGVMLHSGLGTVNAWSYFQKPLVHDFGWTNAQVAATFSVAICSLGLAAAWGGLVLPRVGPRRLAVAGSCLYLCGFLLGALALHLSCLPLLWLGYGVVGGCGLGLGYVTPVATVTQWYPDRKGLSTSLVVMGFGMGALLMSKVVAPLAECLSGGDLRGILAFSGVAIFALTFPGSLWMKLPKTSPVILESPEPHHLPVRARRVFVLLWVMLFINICAGIMFLGFQSPFLQELLSARDPSLSSAELAAAGATLIGATSFCNGIGRVLWGTLSDRIGRLATFRLLYLSQIGSFALLTQSSNPWVFGGAVCYVMLCYGGGFGTMPAFVGDVFGPVRMPKVYGAVLTAWSGAGLVGPLVAATIKDSAPETALKASAWVAVGLMALGLLVTLAMGRSQRKLLLSAR